MFPPLHSRLRGPLRGIWALPVVALALSPTWEDFVNARQGGGEPILPDFSYAGYHRTTVDLPAVAGPLFDVTDYGAVADDYRSDRDAIQAAIDAAESAGGGVVFFPPGQFHLNTWSEPGTPLRIRSGHLVLRGSGAWAGGTELFMEAQLEPVNPSQLYSTPEILLVQPSSTGTATRATITAFSPRESFTIDVSSPGNFAVGDWITLQLDDPDAVAAMLSPKTAEPEWADLADNGLQVRERHQVAAIDGSTLTLEEPLHLDVDPAYQWSVRTYPRIEEVGIEDLAFRGNWLGQFVHHRSALDDSAWSCLQINNVVNGWIRGCRFINWNEAINLHDSSYVTVLHCRIEGNAGHFGIHTRRGYGVLVALSEDRANQWHGPSVGYQSAGTVFWRFDYPATSSFDAHGSGPYATLLDANSGGLLRGRTGGALEGQPNHLRWFTLWNFQHLGSPLTNYDFWYEDATTRDRFLYPLVIGFHGSASTFDESELEVAEAIGSSVDPASLFEAQLALRLGSLPLFVENWKTLWTGWQAQPAETVVYLTAADQLPGALQTAQPGTRIVLANGIYRNQSLQLDGTLTPNGSGGTAEAPIVLTAERAGEVVFTGGSELRFGGRFMVADSLLFAEGSQSSGQIVDFGTDGGRASDCALVNSAIVDYNPDDPAKDYDWVAIRGQRNRIEHCALTGMNHKGVQVVVWLRSDESPSAPVLRGNYFADRAKGTGNGFETIRIGTSGNSMLHADAIVEGNLFERCDGEIEIISNKSVGNLYRGNTFRACDGQLTLRHGSDCTVESNFFLGDYKSGSSGVRIIGPGHRVQNNYFEHLRGSSETRAAIALMNGVPNSPLDRYLPVEDALIAHNTILDCGIPVAIGVTSSEGDTTVPPANSQFLNNVIVGSASPHFRFVSEPTNFSYDGQVDYGAVSGLPPEADAVNLDPMLVPGADGLYRPDPLSPLVDAANDALGTDILWDMDGQARPTTGRDLGADEVSTGPSIWRPLAPSDVGPSWPVVVPDIPTPGAEGLFEGFAYPAGVLRGQGFWSDSAITASRTAENTDAIVVSGGELHLNLDDTASVGTLFSPVFSGEARTNGTLYASLHLRVDALYPASQATYLAAFSSADGNTQRGRLWITDQDAAGGTFRLGVTSKTGSPFAVVKSDPLEVGTTYSVLLEHTFDASSTTTRLYLGASAHTDSSIEESSSGGSPLLGFAFLSGTSEAGAIAIDNLRVSDAFAAVVDPLVEHLGGIRYPDTLWYWSAKLGWYYRATSGYYYHPQAGWWWVLRTANPNHLFAYDYTGNEWWFIALHYFPWIYRFNDASGWSLIESDSTAASRHLTDYHP